MRAARRGGRRRRLRASGLCPARWPTTRTVGLISRMVQPGKRSRPCQSAPRMRLRSSSTRWGVRSAGPFLPFLSISSMSASVKPGCAESWRIICESRMVLGGIGDSGMTYLRWQPETTKSVPSSASLRVERMKRLDANAADRRGLAERNQRLPSCQSEMRKLPLAWRKLMR